MTQLQTFAEWITYYLGLLKAQGRSQAEIARRMHVHPSLLTKWKGDDYGDKPGFDNVRAFADEARLTPEQRAALLRAAGYDVPLSTALDSVAYVAARERYLAALWERYGVVETHAFTALSQDERVGSPRRLPLLGHEGVYIPLRFSAPSAQPDTRAREFPPDEVLVKESPPETLPEILSRVPGHLGIIGDAGSGKTTALHVIVSALASEDPAAAFGIETPLWEGARPLPIFLPLRLFEQACNLEDNHSPYTHCPDDLLRFVDDWFTQWCPNVDLPPGFLAYHIRAGRAWFLLDALDEVADTAHRETVRNVIQDLAGQLNGTRLIVTARVAAYRDIRLDERFTVITVRDLDETQRADMVRAIYRGLALPDHERRATDLVGRFAASETLQALGRTPVMVWTAAVIHALRGELPDSRAALYDAYVDILLKQSFKRSRYDVAMVDDLSAGQGWPLADRRHYLTYAAFQVHAMLATQPERHGKRMIVGEDELVDTVLTPYFHENLGDTPREARNRARDFITLMVERSGLLYETDQGYTFGDHLTMQEFLAAYYLAENYALEDPVGYAAFFQTRAHQSWWREVVLLAAGYLGQKSGFQGRKFLLHLAQGEDAPEKLAALALAGRGLLQLRAGRKRPTWYTTLAQTFANQLYRFLYAEPAGAPVSTRQEAGLVFGALHGMPGEDSLVDPRFTGPQGLPDFVEIPAGTFWMGSTEEDVARWEKHTGKDWFKRELPRHQVTLDAYEIAKYPTTNAMYARFMAAGGYANVAWWAAARAAGYWTEEKGYRYGNMPRYWDDGRWNNPAQPVVGVSWYEATAYCHWLTATLDDGYVYRLPTEAEWERAARGSQGWRYPWGDEWQAGYCNSKEAGLDVTSPVGMFPQGKAEGDIYDLVGNVYEWCADWFAEDTYAHSQGVHNPTGPEQGSVRILRGGGWGSEGPPRCRCGYRIGAILGSGTTTGDFVASEPSPHNPGGLCLVPCSLTLVLCPSRA